METKLSVNYFLLFFLTLYVFLLSSLLFLFFNSMNKDNERTYSRPQVPSHYIIALIEFLSV